MSRAKSIADKYIAPDGSPPYSETEEPEADENLVGAKKRGRGRPTSFKPEFIAKAAELCFHGLTDLEIAQHFGVNVKTIHRWKADHPEFCLSIKSGKEIADDRVERSLYQRAVGYTFETVKIAINSAGDITKVPFIEHVPPETGACAFWLKNRRKAEWRDRHEVEVGGVGDFERMKDEELVRYIQERTQALGLLALPGPTGKH